MAATESVQNAWANLTARERRLLSLLGLVVGVMAILGLTWLATQSMSDVEEENEKIAAVLREIARSRTKLAIRAAERERREARYRVRAPSLASFVEGQAQRQGIEIPDARDLPDKKVGRYTQRGVQVQLRAVKLRPLVDLLEGIEDTTYPVAISRLEFRRRFGQPDQYDVDVSVVAYDAPPRAAGTGTGPGSPSTSGTSSGTNRAGTNGPPPP